MTRSSKPRGLFRWAGGKSHMIARVQPQIAAHLAATGGRLVSLFHGGGAIERACGGAHVAADKSPELLQLLADLQTRTPLDLEQSLLALDAITERTPDAYKALGRAGVHGVPAGLGSARFLWLSAMAFNGVWRVNGTGQMNMGVDRARLAKPAADVLPPLEAFATYAKQIARTKFVEGWEDALALANSGDVLLVDPPYGEFVGYTAAGFGARDQRLLAGALREAADQNIAIIAFNAPGAETLYHWANVEMLTRSGCVSSMATKRDPVAEVLITAGLRR